MPQIAKGLLQNAKIMQQPLLALESIISINFSGSLLNHYIPAPHFQCQ